MMKKSLYALALCGLAFSAFGQSTYTLNFLNLPPSLSAEGAIFVSASRHGNYAVWVSYDSQSNAHYLLYGPDFTKPPQDLNGSAGPSGPKTGGKLWDGIITTVTDEGIVGGVIPSSQGSQYGSNFLYDHRVHTIYPMASLAGFNYATDSGGGPLVNDRNTTVSIAYSSSVEELVESSGLGGGLRKIFPAPGHPTITLTGIDGDNEVLGEAISNGAATGFLYTPGFAVLPVNPEVYGNGASSYLYVIPADISDGDYTGGLLCGMGFYYDASYNTHRDGWVAQYTPSEAQPNGSPFSFYFLQGAPCQPLSIDNSGRVFGYLYGYNGAQYNAVLWNNFTSSPTDVNSLLPAGAPSVNYEYASMDKNGVIYGTAYASGVAEPFTLSPN
jgi:hypothetical protein